MPLDLQALQPVIIAPPEAIDQNEPDNRVPIDVEPPASPGLDVNDLQPVSPTELHAVGLADGSTIKAPPTLGGTEITYHDDIQNNSKSPRDYVGFDKVPERSSFETIKHYLAAPTAIGATGVADTVLLGISKAIPAAIRFLDATNWNATPEYSEFSKDLADNLAARNSQISGKLQENVKDYRKELGDTTVNIGEGLAAIPALVALGPAYAASTFGLQGSETGYEKSKAAGKSEGTSLTIGAGVGTIDAAMNLIYIKRLADTVYTSTKPTINKIIGNIVATAPIIAAGETGKEAIYQATGVSKKTLGEAASDIAVTTAESSAIAGAAGAMPHPAGINIGGVATDTLQALASGHIDRPTAEKILTEHGIKPEEVLKHLPTVEEVLKNKANELIDQDMQRAHQDPALVKDTLDAKVAAAKGDYDKLSKLIEKNGQMTPEIAAVIEKAKIDMAKREAAAQKAKDNAGGVENMDAETIKARTDYLDESISRLDSRIDDHLKLISERAEAGKSTKAVENSLEKILNKRNTLDDERGELMDRPQTIGREKTIQVKGDRLAKAAREESLAQRRGVEQGLRKGRQLAKQDVKSAQKVLLEAIKNSELLPADKAKFLATIKNANSTKLLLKHLPELQARIARVAEVGQANKSRADLKKSLKGTKAKNDAFGKPQGKFTADIQSHLDNLRAIQKMKPTDAAAELDKRLAQEETPTAEQSRENRALSIAAKRPDMTSRDIKYLAQEIRQIKKEGKAARAADSEARGLKNDIVKESIKAVDPVTEVKSRNALEQAGDWAKGGWDWAFKNWEDFTYRIAGGDKKLTEKLSVTNEIRAEKQGLVEAYKTLNNIVREAFDLKSNRQIKKQLLDDSVVRNRLEPGQEFTDARGRVYKKWKLSKTEMRDIYLKDQDPNLAESLRDKEGNAFTEEMIQHVKDGLSAKDLDFIDKQLDFYDQYYNRLNDLYRRLYGVNLPKVDNYSPARRENFNPLEEKGFMNPLSAHPSVTPSAVRSRTKNSLPLKVTSDVLNLQRHVAEVERYLAFAEKMRDLNQIFGDPEVRRHVNDRHGADTMENIDWQLNDFSQKGKESAGWFEKKFNFFLRNKVYSVLAGKPIMALKQFTSGIAAMAEIPVVDYAAGIRDLAQNFKLAHDTLMSSPVLQTRYGYGDLNVDMKALAQNRQFKSFLTNPTIKNSLMWPILLGDKGAVLMGGWPIYKYNIKQGLSHEAALAKVEKWANDTQQSGDIDQLSRAQKGTYSKVLFLFKTAPIAQLRMEIRAFNDFKNGNITGTQFAKKLVIYHVGMQAFFQMVSQAGLLFSSNDDKVKEGESNVLQSMIGGPFGDVPFIGGPVNWVSGNLASAIVGDKSEQNPISPDGALGWMKRFYDHVGNDFKRAKTDAKYSGHDDLSDWGEMLKEFHDTARDLAGYASVPDQFWNIATGAGNVVEGEDKQAAMRLIGYPESQADPEGKENKKHDRSKELKDLKREAKAEGRWNEVKPKKKGREFDLSQ